MTKCEDCKYESERQVPPRPFKYCLYFNRKIKKQFLDGTADCPKFEPKIAMLSTPLTPVKVPVIIENVTKPDIILEKGEEIFMPMPSEPITEPTKFEMETPKMRGRPKGSVKKKSRNTKKSITQ